MPDTPVDNHSCEGCGVLDNHPMVHLWTDWVDRSGDAPRLVENPSFHHDCLPPELERLYDDGHDPRASAAITAAKNGTRGDDLRALIAAHDNGVRPYLSFESTSTCLVSSSCLTVASCPLRAAHDSGVLPLKSD